MSKIIDAYTKRLGINTANVRFLVDGKRISPNDTPKTLEMEDGDIVDCQLEQTGGFSAGI